MENITIPFSKKKIVFYLVIISLLSVGLKIYLVDFSAVPFLDTDGYILHAMSIKNGEFSEPPRKTLGWPLFASPFFYLINSDNFIDYANLMRGLSIAISTASVTIMYLLARKFFSEKYSLVAACLFGFEPHLNQIAGQGLSEPLYIMVIMASFYFILEKKTAYLSFLFAGFLWWIRWPGVIMLLVASLIFFINNKKSPKLVLQYGACIAIFLVVVSPMLLHRYEQYGDFFYFSLSSNFFSGDYGTFLAENTRAENYSAQEYINDFGFFEFVHKFVLTGIYNIADQIFRMLFPYLIVLIPFGILFSFRAFDQKSDRIRANWLLIIVTLGGSILTFSLINERRFLFYLYPFLILFCTIPIERITRYGLSTFSFSKRQKDIALLSIMVVVLILSSLFAQRYVMDKSTEEEKLEFAKIYSNNFDGKAVISNEDWKYAIFLKLDNPELFKSLTINYKDIKSIDEKIDKPFVSLYAKSIDDLITTGQQYDLKYLVIVKDDIEPWYVYLDDVYSNESKYQYLTRVFDSKEYGFVKFNVKVFEIDYMKYNSMTG